MRILRQHNRHRQQILQNWLFYANLRSMTQKKTVVVSPVVVSHYNRIVFGYISH
jgi:hypothetical protein